MESLYGMPHPHYEALQAIWFNIKQATRPWTAHWKP